MLHRCRLWDTIMLITVCNWICAATIFLLVCPPTLAPVEERNGLKYCSPTALVPPCGSGNSCQWGATVQRFICCGAETKSFVIDSVDDLTPSGLIESTTTAKPVAVAKAHRLCPPVPAGLVPQQENGRHRKCLPGSSSKKCVDKGVCLYAAVIKQYVCCAPEEKVPDSSGGDTTAAGNHEGWKSGFMQIFKKWIFF